MAWINDGVPDRETDPPYRPERFCLRCEEFEKDCQCEEPLWEEVPDED